LELVSKFCIISVDLGNVGNEGGVELALCFLFKPLLLEVIQSLLHPELDEKVTEEFISQFSLLSALPTSLLRDHALLHGTVFLQDIELLFLSACDQSFVVV